MSAFPRIVFFICMLFNVEKGKLGYLRTFSCPINLRNVVSWSGLVVDVNGVQFDSMGLILVGNFNRESKLEAPLLLAHTEDKLSLSI